MELDLSDGQAKRVRTNVASLVAQLHSRGIRASSIRCANGAVIYLDSGAGGVDQDEIELAALRAKRHAR